MHKRYAQTSHLQKATGCKVKAKLLAALPVQAEYQVEDCLAETDWQAGEADDDFAAWCTRGKPTVTSSVLAFTYFL